MLCERQSSELAQIENYKWRDKLAYGYHFPLWPRLMIFKTIEKLRYHGHNNIVGKTPQRHRRP